MNLHNIDGKPIVDATEPLWLEVKARDITRGEPQEPESCAIARACRRELDIVEARVHMSRLYLLTRAGEWLRYMVPENARFEIVCYDRAGTFQPGTFRFAAPPPGRRLGDRANQTNIPHKRSGKKRGKPLHLTNLRGWPGKKP